MEYIYAALLLHKLGKEVSEDTVTGVIKAAGADIDASKVKSMIASLKDVDIENELANASAVSTAPAASNGAAPAAEEKKEEAPKEEKKEAAAEGLSSLFG